MKLQIAVDIPNTGRIMELVDKIHDIIDIVEVGTPAVIKEGMRPVEALKAKYPQLTVLADCKIVDGGAGECEDICNSGADIITVLAISDDQTIIDVVETAHRFGRKVLADLICVRDIPKRSRELMAMNVDYVGVHTGVDMQKNGKTPLGDLKELVSAIPREKAAVAGGVSLATVADYAKEKPAIIISGTALFKAPDVRQAVLDMKAAMEAAD